MVKEPLTPEVEYEPDVVPSTPAAPASRKNLMTVLVLSITLAQEVLGKDAPTNGKLAPGQGEAIIRAIENAVRKNFPDIAPMLLGMFGIEMMGIMPMLKDPDKVIADMMVEYQHLLVPNHVNPSPQSDLD